MHSKQYEKNAKLPFFAYNSKAIDFRKLFLMKKNLIDFEKKNGIREKSGKLDSNIYILNHERLNTTGRTKNICIIDNAFRTHTNPNINTHLLNAY